MVAAFTLDELVSEAGDESFDSSSGDSKRFKMGYAYPVEIVKMSAKANAKGRYSVMLNLGRISADNEVGRGDTVFISLPVLTDEAMHSDDPEDIKKYKNAVGPGFLNVLRAFIPDIFQVFASKTKVNGKSAYVTHDGATLTYNQVELAKKALAKPAVGFAMKIVKGDTSLVGMRAYFAWAPNKNNPDFPYANFWSEAPTTVPLAE